MSPNKNARCPCGSGRKYRQCCGKARRRGRERGFVRSRATTYVPRERQEAKALLRALVEDPSSEDERTRAWSEFMPDLFVDFYGRDRELTEVVDALFEEWLAYDRPWKRGPTPVERLLARGDLTTGQRRWLEQVRDTPLGLWEFGELTPSGTATFVHLLTDQVVPVPRARVSAIPGAGNMVLCRILPHGSRGVPEIEGSFVGMMPVGHDDGSDLLDILRQRPERDGSSQDVGDVKRALPVVLVDCLCRMAREKPHGPVEYNYTVRDAEALRSVLDDHPAFERVDRVKGELWFVHEESLDPHGGGPGMGWILMEGSTLALCLRDLETADTLASHFQALAGAAVEYESRIYGGTQALRDEVIAMCEEARASLAQEE